MFSLSQSHSECTLRVSINLTTIDKEEEDEAAFGRRLPGTWQQLDGIIKLRSMAARVVTYFWKIDRPARDDVARTLLNVAYKAAMATDPTTTAILIRYVSLASWR